MRHPFAPAIIRLSPRLADPAAEQPAPGMPPRPPGSRRPHTDRQVAAVRRLVEETSLTYSEISAKTGVGRASICRWTRDQKWQRPPFAPRATDIVPSERASAKLRRRWLGHRISALAERAVRELEAAPSVDTAKLAEALELYKLAKLATGRRHWRGTKAALKSAEGPPLFDAEPREVMKALRLAGIRTENLTEQALVDFMLSRAPPPARNLTRREREAKRMRERE